MIPYQTHAVRDGLLKNIHAHDLVPGDIILLKTGDKVPADAILIQSNELRLDISSLTGESEPVERQPVLHGTSADINALEAKNMVFNGCMVVNGKLM
jgi:sodium/potassium-transporting ATPase subunit alpha